MKDYELDDILLSIKGKDEGEQKYDEIKLPKIEKKIVEEQPLPEPPKPTADSEREANSQTAEDTNKINRELPEDIEELAPPKPLNTETADSNSEESEKELLWIEPKAEKKAENKEKFKLSFSQIKSNFKNAFIPHLKNSLKSFFTKQVLTVIGIVALVIAVAFAGFGAVKLAGSMRLKPYEEKYKVEYPSKIKKEFLDSYGKNPTLEGEITISDTNTAALVYSKPKSDEALLEKGSDLLNRQHFNAVSLSSKSCDLEKYYSTAKAYVKASQFIEIKNIYGKKEKYQIVSAFYTNTNPKDDNGYVFPYNLWGNLTAKSFPQYQDRINTRSLYNTGREILFDDYCLTVSVDSSIMKDFRFVVVAVKANDKTKKITKTEKNEAIHYPQAYCDKLKIHNKYHLAGKWYPEIVLDNGKTKQLTIEDFKE